MPADMPSPDKEEPATLGDSAMVTRDGKGRWIPTRANLERRAAAVELRSEGRTYQQIADELGYSCRKDAMEAVKRAQDAIIRPSVEKLIARSSARLDDLFELAQEVIARNHVLVNAAGKVVCDSDGEPIPDDGPRLQAILTAIRVDKEYRELHGLNAEKKVNVSGGVRYEVVGIDPADLK